MNTSTKSGSTCTHHTDSERIACPVCLVTALTAERDKMRARCDQLIESQRLAESAMLEQLARADKAKAELAAEREKVRELRECLSNLVDEQNGAPLERRREQWQATMDEARAALAATEDPK